MELECRRHVHRQRPQRQVARPAEPAIDSDQRLADADGDRTLCVGRRRRAAGDTGESGQQDHRSQRPRFEDRNRRAWHVSSCSTFQTRASPMRRPFSGTSPTTCRPASRRRSAEANEIASNRQNYVITSSTVGTPDVTFNFQGICPVHTVYGDACAFVPVDWRSTRSRNRLTRARQGNRPGQRGLPAGSGSLEVVRKRFRRCHPAQRNPAVHPVAARNRLHAIGRSAPFSTSGD